MGVNNREIEDLWCLYETFDVLGLDLNLQSNTWELLLNFMTSEFTEFADSKLQDYWILIIIDCTGVDVISCLKGT